MPQLAFVCLVYSHVSFSWRTVPSRPASPHAHYQIVVRDSRDLLQANRKPADGSFEILPTTNGLIPLIELLPPPLRFKGDRHRCPWDTGRIVGNYRRSFDLPWGGWSGVFLRVPLRTGCCPSARRLRAHSRSSDFPLSYTTDHYSWVVAFLNRWLLACLLARIARQMTASLTSWTLTITLLRGEGTPAGASDALLESNK